MTYRECFMDTCCKASLKTCGASPLPFSGLGHDLAPVRARAMLLAVVPAQQLDCPPPRVRLKAHMPHGYALHVMFGRETRGR